MNEIGLIGLTFTSIIGSSKTNIFVEISNILFAILRQPHLGFLILAGLPAWFSWSAGWF